MLWLLLLAIESACTPSCCWTWRAAKRVDSWFMSASTSWPIPRSTESISDFTKSVLVEMRFLTAQRLELGQAAGAVANNRGQSGIFGVDGRGRQTERVGDGGERGIVGAHRRRDRPVGGVVRSGGHALAGGD